MEDEDFGFMKRADGVLKNVNNDLNDTKGVTKTESDRLERKVRKLWLYVYDRKRLVEIWNKKWKKKNVEFVRWEKRLAGIDQWWQRRYSGRPRPETPSLSGQRPPLHPLRLPQSFPTRRTYRTWSNITWKWSPVKHRGHINLITVSWVLKRLRDETN